MGQRPGSLTLRSTMLAGACRKSPSLHASAQTEAWQSVCFVHLNHCLYASYGLACETTQEKVSVGIWREKLPSLPVALTPCPESMTWNQPLCAYDEEERSGLNPLKWGEEISPQILSEAPRSAWGPAWVQGGGKLAEAGGLGHLHKAGHLAQDSVARSWRKPCCHDANVECLMCCVYVSTQGGATGNRRKMCFHASTKQHVMRTKCHLTTTLRSMS